MNRFRTIKDKNYTTIHNGILKDNRLSLKAKGLFITVMSLPDDWDFTIRGIESLMLEGRTAIYNAIDELVKYGYCQVETIRSEGRFAGNEYSFYEIPQAEIPHTENLHTDNLHTENLPQLNTKEIKYEKNKIPNNRKGEIRKEKISSRQTGIPVSEINPSPENLQAEQTIRSALTTLKEINLVNSLNRSEWRAALEEAETRKFNFNQLTNYLSQLREKYKWKTSPISAKDFVNHLHEFESPTTEEVEDSKTIYERYMNKFKQQQEGVKRVNPIRSL